METVKFISIISKNFSLESNSHKKVVYLWKDSN